MTTHYHRKTTIPSSMSTTTSTKQPNSTSSMSERRSSIRLPTLIAHSPIHTAKSNEAVDTPKVSNSLFMGFEGLGVSEHIMKSQLRGVEVGDSAGSSRSHGQGREPEEVQNKLRKEFEKMERENPDVKLKDTNGWVDLCKTLRDADEREGKEVNENIDAILVFSGLFSAVIITLVIEAAMLLKRDPAEATTIVLLQMSQQLSFLAATGNPPPINSSSIAASLPPFTPDSNSIWINALWFSSLALSLISASLGLLVKQWFREYLTGIFVAPHERCRVRFFRRSGLLRYKVPEIASFLPLLLLLSLILFFVGLVIYIRILLPPICWHIIAIIGLWFLFLIVTTLAPLFSPSCPYKTPFLRKLFLKFHQFANRSYDRWNHIDRSQGFTETIPRLFDEETVLTRTSRFDADVLSDAYNSTSDLSVWEMVTRCIDLNSPQVALSTFSEMVARRIRSSVKPWSNLMVADGYSQSEMRYLLRSMVACIHKAFQLANDSGSSFTLGLTEANALITLERLESIFFWEYRSDHALTDMTKTLLWESLSIPKFDVYAKLSVIPSLVSSHVPLSERELMHSIVTGRYTIPEDNPDNQPKDDHISPNGLLELCRVLFIYASRTAEHDQLRSYPNGRQTLQDIFEWQCVMDMASQFKGREPVIVDKSLFEELHTKSMMMFDMLVQSPFFSQHIRRELPLRPQVLDTLVEEPESEGGREGEDGEHGSGEIRDGGEQYAERSSAPSQEPVDPGPSNQDTTQEKGKEVIREDETQAAEHGPGSSKGQAREKVVEQEDKRQPFERKYEEAVQKHPDIKLKDTNGWSDLNKTLRESDEREGKEVNENVDTILVFAGLFSAVIITLVIEASRLLQRDQAEATTMILLHISQQLSSFAITGSPTFINSTTIPAVLPPFTPDTKSKWVNALWLAALVLSLITASLGMLVKQWFREYLTGVFVAPRERCRVRYFRRVGLLWYKVPEIAGVLPILLQLALILFFMGLVIYIRILLPSIGWHIIALIGLWLLFFVVTTLIPLFSPSCPYKTPFLKTLFLQFRKLSNSLYARWKHRDTDSSDQGSSDTDTPSPKLFEEEVELARTPDFDVDVLLNAYDSTKDIDMWDMITRCVDLNLPRDTLATFSKMVERRFGSPVEAWSDLKECYDQNELRCLLRGMTTCIHKAFQLAHVNDWMYGFGRTEADAVVILNRLTASFRRDYTSDTATQGVARMLVEESCSIPSLWSDGPIHLNAIPSMLQNNDPSLRRWMDSFINNPNELPISETEGQSVGDEISLDHVLEVCRVLFLCAARAPLYDSSGIRPKLPGMTARLANKLKTLEDQDIILTIKSHCVLDMAMRLHKRVPGIIDESFFETLHTLSVKMFDSETANWRGIQRDPEGAMQVTDESAGEPDWKKVLNGGEYVEVVVRGVREYTEHGDEWGYQKLRMSCKLRIEFFLNCVFGIDLEPYEF
ncbi:hypothetical protein NLI96_g4912 [Meripilus lineatus]|uniref:DUF6535 domain-containing protein n=1 Tax=Meripilus lineatus TaxID=2056292 RepID=A0AAD5YED0_9APHY|nr:hypothetical protein NLI96_g4912 [Physisporinus lineatus]